MEQNKKNELSKGRKINLDNYNLKWFLKKNKNKLIAGAILIGSLSTIGLINGCISCSNTNQDNPSHLDNDDEKSFSSEESYESGDYVYIIIKSDGRYSEKKLNDAINNKKKIGIIIEPNTNDSFVQKTITNIFDIMSKCNFIDLPILYDVNILNNDYSKNCEIAQKLFEELNKYHLYIGFYGNFDNMREFIDSYGSKALDYDRMLSDIDNKEDYINLPNDIKGNMIKYLDGDIFIDESVIDTIKSSNLNCFIDNKKGIDISSWQEDIDGETLKENGTEFVIIKICDCYTSTFNENYSLDSKVFKNIQECLDNDIPFALYYYTRAKNVNDARLEASFIKRNMKELEDALGGKKIPLFIDVECDTTFEPQQNINDLFSKLYYSDDLSSGYIIPDDEMNAIMQASTIIDSINNYFYQYEKGTLNIYEIANIFEIINNYLENGELYCYNQEGNKIEINDYISYSRHDEKEITDLENNFTINQSEDGDYTISINHYNSSNENLEPEELVISKDDVYILNLASSIVSNHLEDENFIHQLNNCYQPEFIIRTIIDTLGDNYNVGVYSNERILKKISSLDSNIPLWVTSSETYNDRVELNTWNVNFYNDYKEYDIVQYSENGYADGVGSIRVDADISKSDIIMKFIHKDWLIYDYTFYEDENAKHI